VPLPIPAVRCQRAFQRTRSNQASQHPLDIHLSSRNDQNHTGHLHHWHDPLEEVFQQPRNSNPNSIGTSHAYACHQPDAHHQSGAYQQGHQIKCIQPYRHQHLIGKLPRERERCWNNIRSKYINEFNVVTVHISKCPQVIKTHLKFFIVSISIWIGCICLNSLLRWKHQLQQKSFIKFPRGDGQCYITCYSLLLILWENRPRCIVSDNPFETMLNKPGTSSSVGICKICIEPKILGMNGTNWDKISWKWKSFVLYKFCRYLHSRRFRAYSASS